MLLLVSEKVLIVGHSARWTLHVMAVTRKAAVPFVRMLGFPLVMCLLCRYVYTGATGIVHALLRVMCLAGDNGPNDGQRSMLREAIKTLLSYALNDPSRDHEASLMCGRAGVLLTAGLASRASASSSDAEAYAHMTKAYQQLNRVAVAATANEVLYGKAGFVLGCVLLGASGWEPVLDALIREGVRDGARVVPPAPLMYAWHGKQYIGAAHGLLGIVYVLLCLPPFVAAQRALLVAELAWLLDNVESKRSPGQFPTKVQRAGYSSGDFRTHWCHGATGAVFTFTQAHIVLCDPSCAGTCAYMACAERAAAVIWSTGLLMKGPGLCHGVAGNGYALLRMHRVTSKEAYLYQAECFAAFMESADFLLGGARRPDNPHSLFEGLAGAAAFCADLARVKLPAAGVPIGLPAFEVPFVLRRTDAK